MNREIVFILEPDEGRVTVESSRASARLAKEIKRDLGQGTAVNCARPISAFEKSGFDTSGGKELMQMISTFTFSVFITIRRLTDQGDEASFRSLAVRFSATVAMCRKRTGARTGD